MYRSGDLCTDSPTDYIRLRHHRYSDWPQLAVHCQQPCGHNFLRVQLISNSVVIDQRQRTVTVDRHCIPATRRLWSVGVSQLYHIDALLLVRSCTGWPRGVRGYRTGILQLPDTERDLEFCRSGAVVCRNRRRRTGRSQNFARRFEGEYALTLPQSQSTDPHPCSRSPHRLPK